MWRGDVSFWLSGHEYWWSGWFGSQLESREWFRPHAGTRRKLNIGLGKASVEVRVFSTRREGLMITVMWAIAQTGDFVEHGKKVRQLKEDLRDLV